MMKKPSITELLKLLDKPALLSWANKQGLAGIDISVKKQEWLNAGISIHSQIQEFVNHGTQFAHIGDQDRFKSFISGKQILGIEVGIETEWFIGRYDMKLKWGNKIYIVDFKRNHKSIYFENKLQLVAYGMAEQCDCYAIISVPEFSIMNFKLDNSEPYIEIIKSLSNIYKQKQII